MGGKKYFQDFTGVKLCKLQIVELQMGDRRTGWRCICDCGKEVFRTSYELISRKITSCGCYRPKTSKHGHAGKNATKVYTAWGAMKTRCLNKKQRGYKDYGGRGITICDRWLNSFENFLEDMGEPANGYSLERLDVNGNYCPENCIWIPKIDQAKNQTRNIRVIINGIDMCLADACRTLNKSYRGTLCHLRRLKCTPLEALNKTKAPFIGIT